MPSATGSARINKPVSQVFAYFTDTGNWARNEKNIVTVNPTGRISKGWKGVERRRQGGREMDAQIEIPEFEQDKYFVVTGGSSGVKFRAEHTFKDAGSGATDFTIVLTVSLQGLMVLFSPFIGGTVKKALDGTLANFKQSIEAS